MLIDQYKLLKILHCESIASMFVGITTITNSLDTLGQTYINIRIIRKILRFVPKTWEAKVTTI